MGAALAAGWAWLRARPWRLAALLAVALGLAGAVWWRLERASDETWQRIQERGVFTVVTDASYPPFSAVDQGGALVGFDVDLARALGARWGVRVEWENLTYDALLPAVVVGRDDAVISAFVPQPERTREVAYTRSYFVGGTVAVIGAAGEPLADPRQALAWAAGKRLAVEYGASGDALARQWARQAQAVQVLPLDTAAEAVAAVRAGQVDAAVVDAISAYDAVRNQPGLRLAGPPLEPEPYVIAVSAKAPRLLAELEAALAALEQDGTLPALRVEWFGEAARQTALPAGPAQAR